MEDLKSKLLSAFLGALAAEAARGIYRLLKGLTKEGARGEAGKHFRRP